MELLKAKDIAVHICYKLEPFCDKINIAGSIRRQKELVKDIEIVCLPKTVDEMDLFGSVYGKKRSKNFIDAVCSLGKIVKGTPNGRMCQIDLLNIMLDLFIPEAGDYYRQHAIRTGSSNYSAMVIATGWKKKGWCGTPDGLRKIHQCEEKKNSEGKSTWKCKVDNPDLPPVWKDEKEFFDWLEVPYVSAVKREM